MEKILNPGEVTLSINIFFFFFFFDLFRLDLPVRSPAAHSPQSMLTMGTFKSFNASITDLVNIPIDL